MTLSNRGIIAQAFAEKRRGRGRPRKTESTAGAMPTPGEAADALDDEGSGLDPDDLESSEEIAVDTLNMQGSSTRTHGRRARRHVQRETSDREVYDLPDEPPPGWPE